MLKTGYIAHERIKHIITVQRKSKKKKKKLAKTNKQKPKKTYRFTWNSKRWETVFPIVGKEVCGNSLGKDPFISYLQFTK